MLLLNPKQYDRWHNDELSKTLAVKTIEFFESKGLESIKKDDKSGVWYQDFIDFIKSEKVFANYLTIAGYGDKDSRWDMWRISELNEILGFYGLSYWYTWQVSILGLGPIWMSSNNSAKKRAADMLKNGGIFAFGLSEKSHGADIYSTDMILKKGHDGNYIANGSKYYIGNGNKAALVSTFGKIEETGEYVFFVVEANHPNYKCIKKIETSGVRQAFVSEFELHEYPIKQEDILSTGDEAWNTALNTVNVGKFQLGFASIGIATHCFYEAINHAASRYLYGKSVVDFPHVKKLFVESYARLNAMKLYGLRACDYMRAASPEDRRYLLFNPVMKMKVTSEGEQVVGMLHDIIAAKGFEQDTYFEMAIRDIGMLPKLEGTVHVNMALVIKFISNYFFENIDYPFVNKKNEPINDDFLFNQTSGGLGDIKFDDFDLAYKDIKLNNADIFKEQIELFKTILIKSPPTDEQLKNVDFMLATGELFTLVVYAQLIIENIKLYNIDDDLANEIFAFIVRDYSKAALNVMLNYDISEEQQVLFNQMIKKPSVDVKSFNRVWANINKLKNSY